MKSVNDILSDLRAIHEKVKIHKDVVDYEKNTSKKVKFSDYKGSLIPDQEYLQREFDIDGIKYFVIYSEGKRTGGYTVVDQYGYKVGGIDKEGRNVRFPDFKNSAKQVEDHIRKFLSTPGQSLRVIK